MFTARTSFFRLGLWIATGTGAAFLLGSGITTPASSVPAANLCSTGSLPSDAATLTTDDISFAGWMRLPNIDKKSGYQDDFMFSSGALASRLVNGQRRFFVMAGNRGIIEVVDTGSYAATLRSAPVAAFAPGPNGGFWGDVFSGTLNVQNNDNGVPHGLTWAGNGRLYLSYGAAYSGGNFHNPSISLALLDDVTGHARAYGPWRTSGTSQFTSRQGILSIPSDFAAAFLGGKSFGTYSSMASGYGASPFGPNLHAITLPTETNAPDSTTDASQRTASQTALLAYDQYHRLPISARYRRHVPVTSVDIGEGPYPAGGGLSSFLKSDFQESSAWAEELGQTLGEVWVNLPDKQGLVTFGTMVTTLPGYSAPGDPDGLVHFGYGDPSGGTGTGSYPGTSGTRDAKTCYHGQRDPYWSATGPWAGAVVPWIFVHDVHALADVATGRLRPYDPVSASNATVASRGLQLSNDPSGTAVRRWTGGSPVVDPDRRLIFVVVNQVDGTQGTYYPKSAIAVFTIR